MGYKDDFEDGFVDDARRASTISSASAWILKAIDGGVNVGGYFVWSAAGSVLLDQRLQQALRLFYIDFETQKRNPKASAYWYKHVAQTRRLD